jgi:hypothetical protein
MTDAEKILARLDAIDAHLKRHDKLIDDLGCAVPANMEADKFWREMHAGAKAVARFAELLSAIGRFVLMLGGFVTLIAALLNGWAGKP